MYLKEKVKIKSSSIIIASCKTFCSTGCLVKLLARDACCWDVAESGDVHAALTIIYTKWTS